MKTPLILILLAFGFATLVPLNKQQADAPPGTRCGQRVGTRYKMPVDYGRITGLSNPNAISVPISTASLSLTYAGKRIYQIK